MEHKILSMREILAILKERQQARRDSPSIEAQAENSEEAIKNVDISNNETTFLGTIGPYKNIICNSVLFTTNPVFEYSVQFHPDLESENSRLSFITKHFDKIAQKFLYDGFSVFVPQELASDNRKCTFSNHVTQECVTMSLTLKQKTDIESHSKLLRLLLEHLIQKNIYVQQPGVDIISNYIIAIRHCKNGTMLCLDRQYYIVQTESIADLIVRFKKLYEEKYQQAVNIFLSKVYIYCRQDTKIYKFVDIRWNSQLLKLKVSNKLENNQYQLISLRECSMAEIVSDVSPYASEIPVKLMADVSMLLSSKQLIRSWDLQVNNFTKAKARVLNPESILLGDGVKCTPKCGSWEDEMQENEVFVPTELCYWIILYTHTDKSRAKILAEKMQEVQGDVGINIGKPLFFEIESDSKNGYVDALNAVICREIQLVVIIIPTSENKPQSLIKHICCIPKPIPFEIVCSSDVTNTSKVHQIVLQINIKLGGVPWTVDLVNKNWMICGIDVRNPFDNKTMPVCSFVTTLTNDVSQWYSKAVFLEDDFKQCLKRWLIDVLKKYRSTNGILPDQVVIYQNCTKETRSQLYNDYINFDFNKCAQQFQTRRFDVCVILVERDIHTIFFKDLKAGPQNVPPGTIVDDTITNFNSRDFFLVSHYAPNAIARPTHYEVIKDTSGLTADQVQVLTYKMCHLYYKHAKTAEMPAPCLYAQKLAALVTEEIHGIPSDSLDECFYYL